MTAPSARERTSFGNFQLRPSHLKTGGNPYKPGSPDWDRFEAARHFPGTGAMQPLTPADRRAAQLAVAGHAVDVEDGRELLAMLGLLGEEDQ